MKLKNRRALCLLSIDQHCFACGIILQLRFFLLLLLLLFILFVCLFFFKIRGEDSYCRDVGQQQLAIPMVFLRWEKPNQNKRIDINQGKRSKTYNAPGLLEAKGDRLRFSRSLWEAPWCGGCGCGGSDDGQGLIIPEGWVCVCRQLLWFFVSVIVISFVFTPGWRVFICGDHN